ncbi:hypothetical protein C8Q76DRAFT_715190 [Earliella scabrosa]|nr:hypothetical protein C8Q76DRAFT_715190 [Earliella scabrosa]
MSSQDVADIIDGYNNLVVNAYCVVAAASFVFYEYIITFTSEVELFWKRGFSGATVLFLVNRYLVLAVAILNMAGFTSLSDTSCSLLARAAFGLSPLQYIGWATFAGLRSFALNRNRAVAVFVFVISCVPVGVDYSFYRYDVQGVNLPVVGCAGTDTMSASVITNVIGVRSCLITADIILVYETWSSLARRGFCHGRHSFVKVLVYCGATYFFVLLILNILHLVLTMLAINTPFQAASNVSAFTEPITATLISRFLLQLQSTRKRTLHIDTHSLPGNTTLALETLVFDRVAGPIGSSLSADEMDGTLSNEYELTGGLARSHGTAEEATEGAGVVSSRPVVIGR